MTLNIDGTIVTLRDQAPLMKRNDLASLMEDGLTVAEWINVLDQRAYLVTNRAAR